MLPAEVTSSMVLDRVGYSIVHCFPHLRERVFYRHLSFVFGGFYNVTLNIGQPSKPYFLDPDTGSDLICLQCDAPCVLCIEVPNPLYRPDNNAIICIDPLCKLLHPTGDRKCENPEQQCDYEVQFGDGGSSLDALVKDVFYLNFKDGIQLKPRLALGHFEDVDNNQVLPDPDKKGFSLLFSCGYDQIPGPSPHPFDGVLGLGKGKSSIISQLSRQCLVRNVIGHCLSG